MDKRCEGLCLFVGRNTRRHKQHLPQRVTAGGRLRQCEVATMDGIEAAPRWMGSKLPPKSPIFIPIFSCYCPASFVVAGRCCKSCYQTITNYVPLSPFCTSEFCGKHRMRLRCGQGFCFCLYVAFQVVPGRVYLWPLCRQETAVDCSNSLCALSAHSMNPCE